MAYNKLLIADEKRWLKDLSSIDKKTVKRLLDVIQTLAHEPWPDDVQIKKLQAYALADFRLRVGNYRVLFDRDLEKKMVILYCILHRSKLY